MITYFNLHLRTLNWYVNWPHIIYLETLGLDKQSPTTTLPENPLLVLPPSQQLANNSLVLPISQKILVYCIPQAPRNTYHTLQWSRFLRFNVMGRPSPNTASRGSYS